MCTCYLYIESLFYSVCLDLFADAMHYGVKKYLVWYQYIGHVILEIVEVKDGEMVHNPFIRSLILYKINNSKHLVYFYVFRNQVLSNEIKNLKKQVPELLQKNEHDNELIEALMVSVTMFGTKRVSPSIWLSVHLSVCQKKSLHSAVKMCRSIGIRFCLPCFKDITPQTLPLISSWQNSEGDFKVWHK